MQNSVIRVGDLYVEKFQILNDEVITDQLVSAKNEAYEFNWRSENDESDRQIVREQLRGQFEEAVGEPHKTIAMERILELATEVLIEIMHDMRIRSNAFIAAGGSYDDPYLWQQVRFAENWIKQHGSRKCQ